MSVFPIARRAALVAAVLWIAPGAVSPAVALEAVWKPLADLPLGDRQLAETALYDMWGDDPDLWPDWLDPMALRYPIGPNNNIVVVRQPVRQPCGEYGFTVLGPVTPQGKRGLLGGRFCGGTLAIVPALWGGLPDMVIEEGRVRDPDGAWRTQPPQRWRWTANGWGLVR